MFFFDNYSNLADLGSGNSIISDHLTDATTQIPVVGHVKVLAPRGVDLLGCHVGQGAGTNGGNREGTGGNNGRDTTDKGDEHDS